MIVDANGRPFAPDKPPSKVRRRYSAWLRKPRDREAVESFNVAPARPLQRPASRVEQDVAIATDSSPEPRPAPKMSRQDWLDVLPLPRC
ncbi:hypothetical protein [Thiohalocapsa marina]|uniref:hypothetical protein n=1 Tax=Thiohalocapsa marina TaxID=424902 RepID=UPI0036D95E18